jgi:hypothetical protein
VGPKSNLETLELFSESNQDFSDYILCADCAIPTANRYSLRNYRITKLLLISLRSQVAAGTNGPPSLVLAVSEGTDVETLNFIARTLLGYSTPRNLHLRERPLYISVCK